MTHHLGPDDSSTWVPGYIIKRKKDMKDWQTNIGYVVVDSKMTIINVMPGATWFKSLADARKGIAALELAKAIEPAETPKRAHLFWMMMELTRLTN